MPRQLNFPSENNHQTNVGSNDTEDDLSVLY